MATQIQISLDFEIRLNFRSRDFVSLISDVFVDPLVIFLFRDPLQVAIFLRNICSSEE